MRPWASPPWFSVPQGWKLWCQTRARNRPKAPPSAEPKTSTAMCASTRIQTRADARQPCGRTHRGRPCQEAIHQFASALRPRRRCCSPWRAGCVRPQQGPPSTHAPPRLEPTAPPRELASQRQIGRGATEWLEPRLPSSAGWPHGPKPWLNRPKSNPLRHLAKVLRRSACRKVVNFAGPPSTTPCEQHKIWSCHAT